MSKLGKEIISALKETKKKGLVTLQAKKRNLFEELKQGIIDFKAHKAGKKIKQ